MTQPTWAFSVRGQGTDTLEIDIFDVIEDPLMEKIFGGVSAKKVRDLIREAGDVSAIHLRVNSRGGDVFEGAAIYSQLVDHPARVEADVEGLAASMASVVVMAADEIRMSETAMMMIHNPVGAVAGESSDLRGFAELLDKIKGTLVAAYVARADVSEARVIDMMDAETWMTAAEAKELGFADTVKAAKAPDAKALAALRLDGLEPPKAFAQAVAQARADAPPRAQETTDRGADGGAPATKTADGGGEGKQTMDLKTLKAQHPDVFQAAADEGVKRERDRVTAHLTMGEESGDMKTAATAIKEGSEMTATIQAQYLAAGMNKANQSARNSDEATAADALNAPEPQEPDADASAEWLFVSGKAGA